MPCDPLDLSGRPKGCKRGYAFQFACQSQDNTAAAQQTTYAQHVASLLLYFAGSWSLVESYKAGYIDEDNCLLHGVYSEQEDGKNIKVNQLEVSWQAPSCKEVCGAEVQFFVTAAVYEDGTYLQQSVKIPAKDGSCDCSTSGTRCYAVAPFITLHAKLLRMIMLCASRLGRNGVL